MSNFTSSCPLEFFLEGRLDIIFEPIFENPRISISNGFSKSSSLLLKSIRFFLWFSFNNIKLFVLSLSKSLILDFSLYFISLLSFFSFLAFKTFLSFVEFVKFIICFLISFLSVNITRLVFLSHKAYLQLAVVFSLCNYEYDIWFIINYILYME